jgi:hypothetical protein
MSAYLRLHIEKGLSENIRVLTEYDESLQDLLAQKETIAEISRRFLRDGSQRFDECVYTALQDIGDLLSADGVRMLYHTPAGEMETYEWHIKGLPCRIGARKQPFEQHGACRDEIKTHGDYYRRYDGKPSPGGARRNRRRRRPPFPACRSGIPGGRRRRRYRLL